MNNGVKMIDGMKDGIPIGLGYLSVSFGFGIMAVTSGLPIWVAVLISMSCVTSAGQVAGITVMSAMGGFVELALTQVVINMRYALMSLSLSQKLDARFTNLSRLGVSFGVTDEIFAVASGKTGEVSKQYMFGLILIPYVSWALGTLLGAVAGELLPDVLKAALGMAIYGMFIAIVVPPARKSLGVLFVAGIAVALSCMLHYIPVFSGVSGGFAIIICGIAASLLGAIFFPVKEDEPKEATEEVA